MPFIPGKHTLPLFTIPAISEKLPLEIQSKLDQKTKPQGSLGDLELIGKKISLIQDTLQPKILNPTLFIFAADHGITHEGVSAYPQEVTYQMVLNFLQGGAAANVLARQAQTDLKIIDSGVNHDFEGIQGLKNRKLGKGTRNFLKEPAMNEKEVSDCLEHGKEIVHEALSAGINLMAFGEMGIGNTSASSLITHILTGISLDDCIGSGTGMHSEALDHKKDILQQSLNRFDHEFPNPSLMDVMRNFGGFEILMMSGTMLEASSHRITLVVDGFISTAAWLIAYFINPEIIHYTFFSHLSGEKGHQYQLNFLGVKPILNLNLRLGEGTGALLSIPIIQAAVRIINEMASFESAGVSQKDKE